MSDAINHPDHYGGKNNPYEAIKVIQNWGLGFNLGNAVKYISRAGKKTDNATKQDLGKALWYIAYERINHMEPTKVRTANTFSSTVVADAWGLNRELKNVLDCIEFGDEIALKNASDYLSDYIAGLEG